MSGPNVAYESGYHQICIRSEINGRPLMIISFGLTNTQSTFMRVITQILRTLIGKFLVIYFDDILIYSHSTEQYLDHLRQVCTVLRKEELYANPKKCTFLATQFFVVSSNGVSADPKKVRAIEEWPEPKTIREMRSFYELAIFY